MALSNTSSANKCYRSKRPRTLSSRPSLAGGILSRRVRRTIQPERILSSGQRTTTRPSQKDRGAATGIEAGVGAIGRLSARSGQSQRNAVRLDFIRFHTRPGKSLGPTQLSYILQAIVGSSGSLDGASSQQLVSIELTAILKIAPLTSEVRERHNIPFLPLTDGGVEALPQSLDLLCCKLSQRGLIAYVEAEFFGGNGEQAHVLYEDGVLLGLPVIAEDAINQALRHFGVLPGGDHDEFAAVGLGRFRDTDEWTRGPGS